MWAYLFEWRMIWRGSWGFLDCRIFQLQYCLLTLSIRLSRIQVIQNTFPTIKSLLCGSGRNNNLGKVLLLSNLCCYLPPNRQMLFPWFPLIFLLDLLKMTKGWGGRNCLPPCFTPHTHPWHPVITTAPLSWAGSSLTGPFWSHSKKPLWSVYSSSFSGSLLCCMGVGKNPKRFQLVDAP